MKWLKLFTEARTDGKLRMLTPAQHLVWFNLLCLAAEQEERGTVSYELIDVLAVDVARDDVELLKETLGVLEKYRIIERHQNGDTLQVRFVHFAERQRFKPSDAPEKVKERVAEHRARKKEQEKRSQRNTVTPCNGVTTKGNAVVTPCNGVVEEIRREEIPENPPTPQGGSVAVSPLAPGPDLEDEPFNAPGESAPPPPPRVVNDPAEVLRVGHKAQRLFPACDFAMKIEMIKVDVPMAHVDYALDEAHTAGVQNWKYIRGILRKLAAEGPGALEKRLAAKATPSASRRTEPSAGWPEYVPPTEADLERVHFIQKKQIQKAEERQRQEDADRAAGRITGPKLFMPRPMERRA